MRRIRRHFLIFLCLAVGATILFWTLIQSSDVATMFIDTKGKWFNHSRMDLSLHRFPFVGEDLKYFPEEENHVNNLSRMKSEMDLKNFQSDTEINGSSKCLDIISGMSKGRWIKRPLTPQEQNIIDTYLHNERGFYRIPLTYQRDDGRCGDVPYKDSPLYKHMWFKAICNAKGVTPCCKFNRCVASTEEDCRCPTCYDERQAVHAEYAQWTPNDERCGIKNFTKEEACKMLNGTTIHFVGDSFIRHVFVAIVLLLTNEIDGVLKNSTPQYLKDRCTGMYQITGSVCRDYLDQDRLLCNGTVKIMYIQVFAVNELNVLPPLIRTIRHVNKSIMVLGLGIHNNFHLNTVAKKFLLPLLNFHQILASDLTVDVDIDNILTYFSKSNISFESIESDQEIRYVTDNEKSTTSVPQKYEYLINNERTTSVSSSDKSQFGNAYSDSTNSQSTVTDTLSTNKVQNSGTIYTNEQMNSNDYRNLIKDGVKMNLSSSANPQPYFDDDRIVNLSIPQNIQSTSAYVDTHKIHPRSIFETASKSTSIKRLWPRLFWVGTHAPGLLKSSKFKEQTAESVQNFNKGLGEILKHWKVPYLETFDLTNGTVSFDGTHYGWGINMLKVNMFLTYVEKVFMEESDWWM
uniref:Uncharacterized protein n=1 Tax=Arion vulgaris TaxID=1028688 RepID=A0A0B7A549_9EUPU